MTPRSSIYEPKRSAKLSARRAACAAVYAFFSELTHKQGSELRDLRKCRLVVLAFVALSLGRVGGGTGTALAATVVRVFHT